MTPLQVTGKARAVIEYAEQDRSYPLAARDEYLARAKMRIPEEETTHVIGIVDHDLAIEEARLGTLRAFGAPRGEAPPLLRPLALRKRRSVA